ncbi:MAG TPA: Mov34/MPN/PAD-1 family protein [Planctomycetota bacterium]|nr:Mov34/MPN/PAD-1 family protein [Planctomycetota bacterium]
MRVLITTSLCEQIISSLKTALPDEGCGVLIGRQVDDETVEVTTSEALPNAETLRGEDHFVIEPHAYAELERRLADNGNGERAVGFFHSHPNGIARPSRVDLEAASGLFEVTRTFYLYAIAAINADGRSEMTFWTLNPAADEFVAADVIRR